jgi:hypothetical protein
MMPSNDSLDSVDVEDPVLADLVEELTARLQSGEVVDIDDWAEKHPTYAHQLRELLPALQALAGAGISSVNGSGKPARQEATSLHGKLGDYHILREIGRAAWASFTKPAKSRSIAALP